MSRDPSFSRIHRLAANFGLAVASSIIFLGLLEGSFRIVDRVRGGTPIVQADPVEALYRPHPYLPTELRPSTDYRDGDTSGHINALGLRGPEIDPRKPPGTLRVLCVGGSTTFGAGILGDENTYPARLEAHLAEARPDLRIQVLNAGVPGYTTAENIIYLSLRLLDLEPDVVVLYEGYNDFKPNRHAGFKSDYSHWRNRSVTPRRSWLERWRIYTRMRSLLDRLLRRAEDAVRDPATGKTLERFDGPAPEGLETFRRNLITLIAVSRSAGARVALATYAHPCTEENLRKHPDLFRYMPGYLPGYTFAGARAAFDAYNDVIRSVAKDQKALLADAAGAVPPDPGLFVDHVHFNDRGADLFAGVVMTAILPALSADESGGDS